MSAGLAELERQARRLRFADREWEERFETEKFLASRNRVRGMVTVAVLVTGGFGLVDAVMSAAIVPDFIHIDLILRFFVIVPAWCLLWIPTIGTEGKRSADWVFVVAPFVALMGTVLIRWHHGFFYPQVDLVSAVLTDTMLLQLVTVLTVPLRFSRVIFYLVLSTVSIGVLFWFTREDGRYAVTILIASMIGFGVVTAVLVWYREAGERRLFAQREHVAVLNTELSRLNAEKNEFMAIAAHDLRAPLASVRGLAEMLRSGAVRDAEKADTVHGAIMELSDRMLGLVDDYLGAHAVESAMLQMRSEVLDLGEVAWAAAKRFSVSARAKNQEIVVDAEVGRVRVRADRSMLDQVLDNFVSNALKFSPEGAEIELVVLSNVAGDRARLAVSDHGPGIPAAEQGGLFRMFGRTSVKPTAGEKSHGIGLAVTKRLAGAMDGAVGCDSPIHNTGTGSAFWIELPTG